MQLSTQLSYSGGFKEGVDQVDDDDVVRVLLLDQAEVGELTLDVRD